MAAAIKDVAVVLTDDEFRRLVGLISIAYKDGFMQGTLEHTTRRGGVPWTEARQEYLDKITAIVQPDKSEAA